MSNSAIIVADYQTSLAAKLAVGATTGTLQSNLDDDGVTLPTGDYYFTIDGDSSQKEHIKCVNTAGNLTAIFSVSRQGVLTSGTVREHRVGATVTITDFAHIKVINDFVNQYDGRWEGAVANFAALPQPASDGEARVTLDDSKLYVYDLDTTTWNLAGAGGGAGTVYITTLLGTESTGDDNKTFTLTSGSFPDKKYLQVYKNGVLMSEGAANDYVAGATNTAVFNAVVLDDDVITLLVVSVDLYNPAWSQVNADIIPTTDATYSIGSALKKFTTGFFSGIMTALSYLGDGSTLDDSTNGKLTSGTTANKLLRLDANAKIPAVDGSQITNLAFTKVVVDDTATAQVTNSTAETTLKTYIIPAGLLSTNKTLRMFIFVDVQNNNGSKTFKVKFGGTTILATGAQSGILPTMFEIDVTNLTASSQKIMSRLSYSTAINIANTELAINTAAEVTVLITAQNAALADVSRVYRVLFELI